MTAEVRAHHLALLSLTVAWPAACPAQTPPAALQVSLRDAVRWGAAAGPGVGPARAPLPATRDAAAAAGRMLRPAQLTLTGGYRGLSGSGGLEVGVAVSQELPLANLHARRSDVARAWGAQARHSLRLATLEAAARAALAWSRCVEADALRALREDALQQAQGVWRVSQARVNAGTSLPSDEALARSDVATTHAAALDAEGQAIEAYAELRFALGKPANAPLVAVGSLDLHPGTQVSETAPAGALATNPGLASATAHARLLRSQTELVAATQGPGIVLGAQYLHEGGGAQIVTGFVGLPLPFTQPARFDRARELGLAQRAEAEISEVRSELEKALSLAAHDRVHWREAASALSAGADAAQQALRITLAGFEAGTSDISPLLLARQRWLSAQEQAVHARAEIARADLRFDALTGHLLPGAQP